MLQSIKQRNKLDQFSAFLLESTGCLDSHIKLAAVLKELDGIAFFFVRLDFF